MLLLARETPLLLGIGGSGCLFDWYTFFQIPSPWVLRGMVWGNQKVLGWRQVLEITLKLPILRLDFFFEVFLRRVLRHLSLLCALRGSNRVVQSGVDFLLDTLLKKPSCAQNSKIESENTFTKQLRSYRFLLIGKCPLLGTFEPTCTQFGTIFFPFNFIPSCL